jgi:hypothetical protein
MKEGRKEGRKEEWCVDREGSISFSGGLKILTEI